MRWIVPVIIMISLAGSRVDAQVAKPRAKTGPSAASLATAYSGPLKFSTRVLAQERAAANDPDAITRGASWRYRYSVPIGYYGGYYGYYGCYGYRGYCGYRFGFGYGGTLGAGFWGPSY